MVAAESECGEGGEILDPFRQAGQLVAVQVQCGAVSLTHMRETHGAHPLSSYTPSSSLTLADQHSNTMGQQVSIENFVHFRWQIRKLHRWTWKDVRWRPTGPNCRWTRPSADRIELFKIASVPVVRYYYRGAKIPIPGPRQTTPDDWHLGELAAETDTAGSASGLGKRNREQSGAAPPRPTQPSASALTGGVMVRCETADSEG